MPSIRDMLTGKAPRKKRDKRALVCVDYANWRPYLSEKDIRINWREFKMLMEQMFAQIDLHFYDGMITKDYYKSKNPLATLEDVKQATEAKKAFFQRLKDLGYAVKSKPISQIYKGFGEFEFKCNFDVEITIRAMEDINNYDVLVLCTGDGDFVELVRTLKRNLKETYAISIEGRFNRELKQAVNSFDYLDRLLLWVQNIKEKKQTPT